MRSSHQYTRARPTVIRVHDRMQRNFHYTLTEREGAAFSPRFNPDLTPQNMLELGVFGGKYLTDCRSEFPPSWFTKAKLSPKHPDPSMNCFGVLASQNLQAWQAKGWIHPDDPRGWFQWYCRYYLGRRCEDDERQMARWRSMRRHIAQLQNHCMPGDASCRPRQRQALLHWAYDSRQL